MDELIQAMSIAELEAFKVQYKDNASIVKIVDGYIEIKTRQEAQDKAKADFGKAIGKMVDKLPHPEDVHNIYMAWQEVEEEDTSQEAEEVELTAEDGSKTTEVRYPLIKVNKWIVELNKGFQVKTSSGTPTASKRAITVKKIVGDTLEPVGNFPSASKACEHLSIPLGGDSATRVLQRDGYLVQAYQGTEFTTS